MQFRVGLRSLEFLVLGSLGASLKGLMVQGSDTFLAARNHIIRTLNQNKGKGYHWAAKPS